MQATQAHRAPHCRHVLSLVRDGWYTCTHRHSPVESNTASPIRSCPPRHPYLCGVVLSTDACRPSQQQYQSGGAAPSASSVSHRGPDTETLSFSPPNKTCQIAQGFAVLRYGIPHRDNDSVKLKGPSTRAELLGNSQPSETCILRDLSPGPGSTKDPRISSTIQQARSPMHVMYSNVV